MWRDDLRGIFYIALKDMRAYYLKPPNISWGILFPGALILAFAVRTPGDLRALAPGLVAMTALFSATSMEAIVIAFERRTGALERLLLAPLTLPAMLAGKVLGGMMFGLVIGMAALVGVTIGFDLAAWRLAPAILTLLLSTMAFSALGAFVSVAVQEVFEAQTLANLIRFPMIFLCGVFVPLDHLPAVLQVLARALPMTYAVEALEAALLGMPTCATALDLAALAGFTVLLFALATIILRRRLD
ncbi:MAG: ABC transporter permease [Anaerolineae bacterium]|nr:ABC transporter permease [Anaerolineae bacterium]